MSPLTARRSAARRPAAQRSLARRPVPRRSVASRLAAPALLLLILAVIAAAAGLLADPAAAKSYSITTVTIDATVQPDGDLVVNEMRELDFSGNFHFVYWDLLAGGSDGIDVTGAKGPDPAAGTSGGGHVPYKLTSDTYTPGTPGTYSVTPSGGGDQRVQLNFDVADASAQFSIDEVAKGAAKRWSDTAELYWKFIGDQADVPCDHVVITVHLPKGVTRDQVRAWAHGPLNGNVTIMPDASVRMTVDNLPARTFVEGRILFPAEALPKAPLAAGARVAKVLKEEKKWADDANRSRLWAKVKIALWSIPGFLIPLLTLIYVIWAYLKYGREPKPVFQAQYLREVPEPPLQPALLGYLWRMGSVESQEATATLLDLVNRKVLDLERVQWEDKGILGGSSMKISYKLTRHPERMAELLPYEQELLTLLFEDVMEGESFVLKDLKDTAKKKRTTFAAGYKKWIAAVDKEGEQRQFVDDQSDTMALIGQGLGGFAAFVGGLAGFLSGFYWFLISIPLGLALIYVARTIRRRSQPAAELHAQFDALRRYMKDFGRLQEKPPDAVVLWEQFLVYAVVFGIADQVVRDMALKVPQVVNDPAFGPSYMLWYAYPGEGGGISAFSDLQSSFSQAVSVATSSSSSGSGGGGGFSGGGGGGGGGGGFGAG